VKRPGSYPYRKDLTIEKAVALAGGFTERASKGGISLVAEEQERNVDSAALNNAVKPGDVITVSESFF
jgi:polysaccharide export outer membrane protein